MVRTGGAGPHLSSRCRERHGARTRSLVHLRNKSCACFGSGVSASPQIGLNALISISRASSIRPSSARRRARLVATLRSSILDSCWPATSIARRKYSAASAAPAARTNAPRNLQSSAFTQRSSVCSAALIAASSVCLASEKSPAIVCTSSSRSLPAPEVALLHSEARPGRVMSASLETGTPGRSVSARRRATARMSNAFRRGLRLWDRQRQRRALLDQDEHPLSDIGKTRQDALIEGRKPFRK